MRQLRRRRLEAGSELDQIPNLDAGRDAEFDADEPVVMRARLCLQDRLICCRGDDLR